MMRKTGVTRGEESEGKKISGRKKIKFVQPVYKLDVKDSCWFDLSNSCCDKRGLN